MRRAPALDDAQGESMSATTARARVDSVAVRSTVRSRVGSRTSFASLARLATSRGAGDARDGRRAR